MLLCNHVYTVCCYSFLFILIFHFLVQIFKQYFILAYFLLTYMSEEKCFIKEKEIQEDCYVYVMCAPNIICVVLIFYICITAMRVIVVGLSLK